MRKNSARIAEAVVMTSGTPPSTAMTAITGRRASSPHASRATSAAKMPMIRTK
jgi:hypothetical protein